MLVVIKEPSSLRTAPSFLNGVVRFGACGGGVEKNVVGRVVFLLVGRVIMEGNRKSN